MDYNLAEKLSKSYFKELEELENFRFVVEGGYSMPLIFNHEIKITEESKIPNIKQVIFNNPATIVIWQDNSKTVVKCQEGDTYDKEKGLAMCIVKKLMGNRGNFNEIFKKWCKDDE